MLTVNNESSLTIEIESRLADSDGKELKSSSTVQLESRFTDLGTLGRLLVDISELHQHLCLCYCRCPIS